MESMHKRLELIFFFILLAITAVVVFFIVKPLLAPLVIAVSLGLLFMPTHRNILRSVRGHENIAAFISLLIVIALVIIPLGIISFLLFRETANLYADIATGNGGSLSAIANEININLARINPRLHIDLASYAQFTLGWLVGNLGLFFSEFFSIALKLFLLILTLFYFFKRGSQFRRRITELSPLSAQYNQKIITRLTTAVTSVIRGSLIVGAIQGILAGFGTAIFGLPTPVIWGVTAGAASFVPGVGTLLVMGPAIISRFAFGHFGAGIGLLIWYICTLILVDNILSPYIIERGVKIHSLFILISVLGGIVVFGPIGFIVGPIFLALFFALLEIYPLLLN